MVCHIFSLRCWPLWRFNLWKVEEFLSLACQYCHDKVQAGWKDILKGQLRNEIGAHCFSLANTLHIKILRRQFLCRPLPCKFLHIPAVHHQQRHQWIPTSLFLLPDSSLSPVSAFTSIFARSSSPDNGYRSFSTYDYHSRWLDTCDDSPMPHCWSIWAKQLDKDDSSLQSSSLVYLDSITSVT